MRSAQTKKAREARVHETRVRGQLVQPAEWQSHKKCLMAFSAATGMFTKRQIERIRLEQADIARAITQFEPVTMLTNRGDISLAKELCGPGVQVVELEHYDVWARDTLPTFSIDEAGQLVAVDWNFNVWGEKFRGYDADREFAEKFARHSALPRLVANIVTEGGAFEVDGEGTLLATEPSLLNKNRNPGVSREEIESEFGRLTGARKVIWLKGMKSSQITDSHVDGFARFVGPGVVVVEDTDHPGEVEAGALAENVRRLEAETDANGRKLEVVRLKRPRWDVIGKKGKDFAATYVNCYFTNGGIVMPEFGDAIRDFEAREIFETVMPGREVIQLRHEELSEGGGGVHCATQHIPAV